MLSGFQEYFSTRVIQSKYFKAFVYLLSSLIIVAFGQPAYSSFFGILASSFGYALFWNVVLSFPNKKKRFWISAFWFSAVQAIQLFWLLSHPFSYIYGLYFFLCFAIGLQFGCLGVLITPARVKHLPGMLAIAAFYTLMEWSRLFFFSGFSLNPIGLSLTTTLWGLQNASLLGVYGLTFYVIICNLVALQKRIIPFAIVAVLPYLFGFLHVSWHRPFLNKESGYLNALLIQTAFPVEEAIVFSSFQKAVNYVEEEWEKILKVLQSFKEKHIDLIVLPEYVVPYGTYIAIYPYENVKKTFEDLFGKRGEQALPALKEPLALEANVTNAYYGQAIANLFNSDVVIGLQDDQWISAKETESYSSAYYFWPRGDSGFRYEKRILLPMGEYIPFKCCQRIAAKYGITGSFRPGEEAKVFPGSKVPFGLSVCYEETYGNLMRESRLKGSELLINVTSDVWYPNSRLPKQHFDHARLRSIEMGIPLVRACNTGITSAFNSLGEVVESLNEKDEWVRQGLFVKVPLYHYPTLYSFLGDGFIISLSFGFCFFLFDFKQRKP